MSGNGHQIATVALKRLKPAAYNPRRMSDEARSRLAASIDRWGLVEPIVWNKRSGNVVGGHQRLDVLKERGDTSAKVVVVDLPPDEEKALNIALNNQALAGEWDWTKLGGLLDEVAAMPDLNPDLLGFDALADELLEAMPQPPGDGLTDPDAIPDPPKKAITKPGDIWLLGDHRLLCGDATKPQSIKALMGDAQADLGLTSPPYWVGKEYERQTTFAEHLALLEKLAQIGLTAIRAGGFFFINFDDVGAQKFTKELTGCARQCIYPITQDYWRIFRELKYELYASRIWFKPFSCLSKPFWTFHSSIPHYQEFEHLWTWRLPGGGKDQCFDWDISSKAVWDNRKEASQYRPLTTHMAAFPIYLPIWAMRAHSSQGALVWEPFCGSGTTIIAAERLRRRCFASELEPRYCDVAVERWEQFTGRKAKRAS